MAGDPRRLIHTPAEQAQEFVAWAQAQAEHPGIPWGVQAIDKRVIPLRPGNLVSIIARPGHGKTSLLAFLARQEAKRIQARGTADKEAVLYCTWEQAAEEMEAFFQTDGQMSVTDIAWGRADVNDLIKRSLDRAQLPIWVVGHGIGRGARGTPRMTPQVVLDAITSLEADYGVKPALVLFDYIQIVPIDSYADSRVTQVSEAVVRSKELGLRVGCPVVMGVQAGREVDGRKLKIPDMADAQWCSGIEQTSDKLFGLWRPILTEGRNAPDVRIDGRDWPVTNELLVVRLLKQRFAPGSWTWALHFAPQYLTLCDMETRMDPFDAAMR